MPIQAPNPFAAFLDGRRARQDEEYGKQRNALAQMELDNAPAEMERRNRLADLELRGMEQQYSQDQVTQALKQTVAAASRLAQSPNPRAEAQVYRDFLANLRKQNPEIDRYNDDELKQYMGWVAGEAQAKLGIAPEAPAQMTPYQQAQIDLDRDKMNAPKTMSPYEQERIKIERQKLSAPKPDAGPLVQVAGPDGKPMFATRDEARGKQAYVAPTAANTAPSAQQKKLGDAKDVTDIIAIAEPLIAKATNSYIGAGADQVARAFGKSTEGGAAISQLKAIQAALMLKMPRMEGPQSNLDVQLYREAAGQIGDPTVPAENKLAALNAVKQIQAKYIENAGGGAALQATQAAPAVAPKRVKVDAQGNVLGN
jgi:hypothetical protein